MTTIPNKATTPNDRRGLTIVEVVVSASLVSLVLIGAMNCLAGMTRGMLSTSDVILARSLAEQLEAEILQRAYADPNETPVFGRESSEAATPRSGFDDVDDYHGWTGNPPQNQSGTALPGLTGWQRIVTVEWVDPANPMTASGSDQGVKRITVTVSKDGVTLVRRFSVQTDKYEESAP